MADTAVRAPETKVKPPISATKSPVSAQSSSPSRNTASSQSTAVQPTRSEPRVSETGLRPSARTVESIKSQVAPQIRTAVQTRGTDYAMTGDAKTTQPTASETGASVKRPITVTTRSTQAADPTSGTTTVEQAAEAPIRPANEKENSMYYTDTARRDEDAAARQQVNKELEVAGSTTRIPDAQQSSALMEQASRLRIDIRGKSEEEVQLEVHAKLARLSGVPEGDLAGKDIARIKNENFNRSIDYLKSQGVLDPNRTDHSYEEMLAGYRQLYNMPPEATWADIYQRWLDTSKQSPNHAALIRQENSDQPISEYYRMISGLPPQTSVAPPNPTQPSQPGSQPDKPSGEGSSGSNPTEGAGENPAATEKPTVTPDSQPTNPPEVQPTNPSDTQPTTPEGGPKPPPAGPAEEQASEQPKVDPNEEQLNKLRQNFAGRSSDKDKPFMPLAAANILRQLAELDQRTDLNPQDKAAEKQRLLGELAKVDDEHAFLAHIMGANAAAGGPMAQLQDMLKKFIARSGAPNSKDMDLSKLPLPARQLMRKMKDIHLNKGMKDEDKASAMNALMPQLETVYLQHEYLDKIVKGAHDGLGPDDKFNKELQTTLAAIKQKGAQKDNPEVDMNNYQDPNVRALLRRIMATDADSTYSTSQKIELKKLLLSRIKKTAGL